MKTIDHKILAEWLVADMNTGISDICAKAFIFGCIEPDMNPVTYCHGLKKGKKLHGHNYENILPIIKKIFHSLHSKDNMEVLQYYNLGKLIHYVADTFTYPHNKCFKGTIRQHCEYESLLHEKFENTLKNKKNMCKIEEGEKQFNDIEELHDEYLSNAYGYKNDCLYIPYVTSVIFKQECEYIYHKKLAKMKKIRITDIS